MRGLLGAGKAGGVCFDDGDLFGSIYDDGGLGVAVTACDGWRVLKANQACLDMLGYGREELLKFPMANIVPSGGDFSVPTERRVRRKDGTERWLKVFAATLRGGDGKPVARVNLLEDVTAKKQAEVARGQELKGKDDLLRSTHRRMRGDMLAIAGLLKLKGRDLADAAAVRAFANIERRVLGLAAVHEKLHRSEDLVAVDAHDFFSSLMEHLAQSHLVESQRVDWVVDARGVTLPVDYAMLCASVVSELAANAFMHAFPDFRPGLVETSLRSDGDGYMSLVVKDNGIGLPEDVAWRDGGAAGLQLATLIAEQQLNGKMEIDSSNGSEFKITFPFGGA